MLRCGLCPRRILDVFTVTVLEGPADDEQSWRRGLAPLCPICHRLLAVAGANGRTLKGTGQRWFLGHTVGRIQSPGAPG